MSDCKRCAMESSHCEYCCDGSQIDLLQTENTALKSELEALNTCEDCTAQEIEIKKLKGFKESWLELKTQLVFSVENYEEDCDMSVVNQVLEEMAKQEKINHLPDAKEKVEHDSK